MKLPPSFPQPWFMEQIQNVEVKKNLMILAYTSVNVVIWAVSLADPTSKDY